MATTKEPANTGGINKTKNGTNGSTKSAVRTLLALARQDTKIAAQQKLLMTFLQIGASFGDVQEMYKIYPQALTRDVLFQAAKLVVPTKILDNLTEKLVRAYLRPDGLPLPYYDLPSHLKDPDDFRRSGDFRLEKDSHLLTSGNVSRGLQQVLRSNVVNLQAFAPTDKKFKPFWNLQEFIEFLGEIIKSKHLETLQFTFPKERSSPKIAPASSDIVAKAEAKEEAQPTEQRQKKEASSNTDVCMSNRLKNKLSRRKLEELDEGCRRLTYVRIDFDYSHETSVSFLQMVSSLGNLPSLEKFFIKIEANDNVQSEDFTRFKAEFLEAIEKLVLSSKSLESLVIDAEAFKEEVDWEPILKVLKKNPPLQRLLIRGFYPGNATEALLQRYSKDDVCHINLEPFKRKLLQVVQEYNTSLTDVCFVIPKCRCDSLWNRFGEDECPFNFMNDENNLALITCTPVIKRYKNGKQTVPSPVHVPELKHLLSLNAHGRVSVKAPDLTHRQFLKAITEDGVFLGNESILYALLRDRAEFVPMLYSNIQQSPSHINFESDELYLAATGKISLPLERFAELCVRHRDNFSSLYNFLRLFPTIWLEQLRTAKKITQEQTKRSKKDYVSVVELFECTQIIKTGVKCVSKDGETNRLAVYGTQIVKANKKDPKRPVRVIRLNVAPSVGGGTLTKFPKLKIGSKGQLVFKTKKNNNKNRGNRRSTNNNAADEGERDAVAGAPKQKRLALKDTSNQIKIKNATNKLGTKTKPAAKESKKRTGQSPLPKVKTKKTKKANFFKFHDLDKIGLGNLKIEGFEDDRDFEDPDEVSQSRTNAKKPARQRSRGARRKIYPANRARHQPNFSEIIGEATDGEENIDPEGIDADWGLSDVDDINRCGDDDSDWDGSV